MKKRMISLLLVLALAVGICPAAFAAHVSYVPYSDSITTPEEQERHERELALANPNLGQEAGISSRIIVAYGEGGLQRGADPGEGAISITTGNLYTLGTIYWDSELTNARFKAIASLLLTFAGVVPGTIGKTATALSIAEDVLGVAGIHGDVEMESPGHIKAGHSVSFLTKTGEFYCDNRWEIAVYTQKKFHFAHEYASVVVDGVARQRTKDEVPDEGYDAYSVDYSAHYNDHTFIQKETEKRYREKKETGYYGPYDERWF